MVNRWIVTHQGRMALFQTIGLIFDNDDNTFTAPGYMFYFDSEGTRDGDRRYEGKYSPVMDENNSNWNGIVEYIWDFGDASPLSKEPSPWHFYENSGTYTVTLTVRDSYGTGDVSKQSFTWLLITLRISKTSTFLRK